MNEIQDLIRKVQKVHEFADTLRLLAPEQLTDEARAALRAVRVELNQLLGQPEAKPPVHSPDRSVELDRFHRTTRISSSGGTSNSWVSVGEERNSRDRSLEPGGRSDSAPSSIRRVEPYLGADRHRLSDRHRLQWRAALAARSRGCSVTVLGRITFIRRVKHLYIGLHRRRPSALGNHTGRSARPQLTQPLLDLSVYGRTAQPGSRVSLTASPRCGS